MLRLVRHGKRRSLQEGVQLLVTMEEGDMPTLFVVCREIVHATDAGEAAAAASIGGATADAPPPRTIWWHQIDDGDDEAYNVEMRNVSTWRMAHELKGARLHFMNNRANEGIAALEKFRRDLLLYARDAAA